MAEKRTEGKMMAEVTKLEPVPLRYANEKGKRADDAAFGETVLEYYVNKIMARCPAFDRRRVERNITSDLSYLADDGDTKRYSLNYHWYWRDGVLDVELQKPEQTACQPSSDVREVLMMTATKMEQSGIPVPASWGLPKRRKVSTIEAIWRDLVWGW